MGVTWVEGRRRRAEGTGEVSMTDRRGASGPQPSLHLLRQALGRDAAAPGSFPTPRPFPAKPILLIRRRRKHLGVELFKTEEK